MLYEFFLLSLLFTPFAVGAASLDGLKVGSYAETCPAAEQIVRGAIRRAMAREPRSGASVMRLQFHDCFVNESPLHPFFHVFNLPSKYLMQCLEQNVLLVVFVLLCAAKGCDASLLLDDSADMVGEKTALSNVNSLRSYEVIDEAKDALERECPGVVSCADIIVMAARDAVVLSGGPEWQVRLGRRDSLTASRDDSNRIMPSPRSNATHLIDLFAQFGLTVEDLVALSGSHSVGDGRCFSVVFRLYNQSGSGKPDPNMDHAFRRELDRLCPRGGDGNVTGGIDATPTAFDNRYFKDLVRGRGFLNSDQTLYSGDLRTRKVVERFSADEGEFFRAFVEGMIKMGELRSKQKGEIRQNCRIANQRLPRRHLRLL